MGEFQEPRQLKVIIAGAGFCGLTAAIECKRRGMHPILVETYPGPSSHGDLLDFVPNAGRIFNKWEDGEIGRQIWAVGVNRAKDLEFYNSQDVFLRSDPWPQGDKDLNKAVFAGHRGEIHTIVYNYALKLGVEMRLGQKIVQYFDTDTEAGVILADGQKVVGDVVLACDGPRSLARSQLLKLPESRVNSGYAIFRAYFTVTDEMLERSPALASIVHKGQDTTRVWVGRDIHGFIYIWKNGRDCAWVLTHKDDADIGESWSFPAKREDVLHYLDKTGFPDIWRQVLDITPEDRLIDYKLVWRDPLPTWLSPNKRSIVMGDAAHCHLPTSAQGACQAVEDAATVAICLEKAGVDDVPLALQVTERIRYNRSHVIHQASISTRDIYHQNDWTPEFIKKYPDALIIPLYPWITEFDAQKTAETNFDKLAQDVRSGKKGTIEELALPAGGDYEGMKVERRPH